MRKLVPLVCICLIAAAAASAKRPDYSSPYKRGYVSMHIDVMDGDSVLTVELPPVIKFKRPVDFRKHQRLIRNLKKVYPIAKNANRMLVDTEYKLAAMRSDRQRSAYVKEFEKELKKTYTPILKQMTFSQGKLLIKLIDRETSRTSFELVKELRGGFTAFFWQSVARIFGANLKDTYDVEGDDKIVEQLIIYYEAGLL